MGVVVVGLARGPRTIPTTDTIRYRNVAAGRVNLLLDETEFLGFVLDLVAAFLGVLDA